MQEGKGIAGPESPNMYIEERLLVEVDKINEGSKLINMD
jgi:hypothetical protein